MQNRESALHKWLSEILNPHEFKMMPLKGDASFRHYYRVNVNGQTFIAMDSPPQKEPLSPFIKIGNLLSENGIHTPHIYNYETNLGFLFCEDFGDTLLLDVLNDDSAAPFYFEAFRILSKIQKIPTNKVPMPSFDAGFIHDELMLFEKWFIHDFLKIKLTGAEQKLLTQSLNWLIHEVCRQPKTVIHKDFHSRNLMVLHEELGVIDFQDAMIGPWTYDLVSLLKDCYIVWPIEKVNFWVDNFFTSFMSLDGLSKAEFINNFHLTGVQRHLKVLGIFSRLFLRDGKVRYLKDLPRVFNYVLTGINNFNELNSLQDLFETKLKEPLQNKELC